MNYKCVEIPEPDFDASFTDEMVVAAYQDEDDFNPQMPDEYPNVRLSQLEFNIQQTALTAAEAFEAAEDAEQIADQAAQAAQQAEGIAEGAATTAGEAVQSINEHASSTTNPHPANTTQSFAEVVITPLKSVTNGGSVADADYNWFKGVYASLVDGSVLSWIKGLVNQVKSLATRVGLLEDQYILKYVVPVDTASINLTTDKYGNAFNFVEGDSFSIIMKINYFVGNGQNRVSLRINNITSSVYFNINGMYSALSSAGSSYYSEYFEFTFKVYDSELKGNVSAIIGSTSTGWNNSQLYQLATIGANISAINSFQFILSYSTYIIPAGTVILIKKI